MSDMNGMQMRNFTDTLPPLEEIEKQVYEWQMWAEGIGDVGQRKLKAASVLISRVGGLGGIVAYQLAAAGIGRLVLAHAGNIRPSDLNRQLLMSHDRIGTSRLDSAKAKLLELNPRLDVICHSENANSENATRLVSMADYVVDCAPLFDERFALNQACIDQRKHMVECAMYEYEASLTTIAPGRTACLACLSPAAPAAWKREFPVFGAVSGTVGCMAAMEVIKLITGVGSPLFNRLLMFDLSRMHFSTHTIHRNPACTVCSACVPHTPK
jgi:molybdopterin/thiamine biosynthesis adenylyltransferase